MNSSSGQRHREHVITIQSFGTGGNDSLARMFILWISWLAKVKKYNPPAAGLLSKLINFSFVNTHYPSLERARSWVAAAKRRHPEIDITPEFRKMHKHLTASSREGLGAKNKEEGQAAIQKFLEDQDQRELLANSHFYIPVATLGSGFTGSSAIGPVTELAHADQGCWTIPLCMLSTKAEMSDEREEFQQKQVERFFEMPIWLMLADNGYFTSQHDFWNRQLTIQESYNRIDYLSFTGLRSLFFSIIHRVQIDESKLEGSIFAGPGGTLCMGGIDIDTKRDVAKEADRAASFLFDSPFKIEYYPQRGEQFTYNRPKFESLMLGFMGAITGPNEQIIIERSRQHPYVQKFLPEAELFFHRCGSYLGPESPSMFALMARKRPGDPIPLRYPPDDQPLIASLRELEVNIESALILERLGRYDPDAIQSPKLPLITSIEEVEPEPINLLPESTGLPKVYASAREFILNDPDRLAEILQQESIPDIPVANFTDGIQLMDFINERTVARNFTLSAASKIWLAEKLKSFTDVKLPIKSRVSGMDYDCQKTSLAVLANYLTQVGGVEGNIDEISDQGRRTLKTVYLVRKNLGESLASPLFAQ